MLSVKVFESITSMDMFLECLADAHASQCKSVAYIIESDIWGREKDSVKREKALELIHKENGLTVLVIDCEVSSKSLPFFLASDLGIVSTCSQIVWDENATEEIELLQSYLGAQNIKEQDCTKVWNAETICRYGLINKIMNANTITKETREYLMGMTDALSMKQVVAIKRCFHNYQMKKGMNRKALVKEEMKQFCILSEEQYKEMAAHDDT